MNKLNFNLNQQRNFINYSLTLLIFCLFFQANLFGQACDNEIKFSPNPPPGAPPGVCQGEGEFKFEIIETAGDGCPAGSPYEGTGLSSITFVHEYKSPAGAPPVANSANIGMTWTMSDIDRSRAANGTPLQDDKFEITFCDGTTIDLNGDYFAEDDPNTPQVEETWIPYQDGSYTYWDNGQPETEEQHVPSAGPNSTKKSLPAGTLNITETSSNTDATGNVGNRRIEYTIYNVCAYEVDVTETAYSECYVIANINGVPTAARITNTRREEPMTLKCDKVNACYGPTLSSICGGSITPSEEFVINLPPIPNYYEVELVIEGNSMSQGSNIGYISVPSCSTCTTTTATVPTSNFYLWDGYYTAYPRIRVSGSSTWESGPACPFYYGSSATRQMRGNNGEIQHLESKIFPNPSGNEGFNLELTGLKESDNEILITIYDLLGKQVHNEQFNSSGTTTIISLNSDGKMKSGFYMVNMSVNGEPLKQKIQIK